MAPTDKNHIDVNRTDALHLVTFIIARGLLKITHQCLANKAATTPTIIKQRSRHQYAIGIAACGRVQWDSHMNNRKQWDKCHMPDMGKPGNFRRIWRILTNTCNTLAKLSERQPSWLYRQPSTLLWRTGVWKPWFWNMTRSNKTASRNVQRAHTLCNGIGGDTPNATER